MIFIRDLQSTSGKLSADDRCVVGSLMAVADEQIIGLRGGRRFRGHSVPCHKSTWAAEIKPLQHQSFASNRRQAAFWQVTWPTGARTGTCRYDGMRAGDGVSRSRTQIRGGLKIGGPTVRIKVTPDLQLSQRVVAFILPPPTPSTVPGLL